MSFGSNWPLMRCKAFWSPSDMFFFFLVSKTKKYCSFKYCALHRIFCHKLVNIYIFFQYSDIYFHIYRTIKCFCSLFFFFCLLFFFFFKEKSLRMYVDSCQVSTRASAVTVCRRVSVSVKLSILDVRDNTAKPKTIRNKYEWVLNLCWVFFFYVFFHFTEQMGEDSKEEGGGRRRRRRKE